MRRLLPLFILLIVGVLLVPVADAQKLPKKRIGMVIDGPWAGNDATRLLFQLEILELAEGEFDVEFPEDKRIIADWTLEGIRAAIDQLLSDPSVDILLTLGVVSCQEVSQRTNLPKPVVAPTVLDRTVQGMPHANGTSGVKNLNYIVFPNNIYRDITTFLEIVEFRKLAIFFNKTVSDVMPDLKDRVRAVLEPLGLQVQIVNVEQSAADALNDMAQTTEAVYLAPLLHMPESEWQKLVDQLNQRDIPTFALFGESEVRKGVLASVSTDAFPRIARRTALNIQRIMIGDDAGTLRTTFSPGEQLTINMATARAIQIYPPWSVMTDAVVLNRERTETTRVLNINRAVQEALDMNLDLAARRRAVAAAEEDVNQARANLLPQVDLSSLSLWIDPDRADASNGQQAQFTLDGRVTLNQVIFADPLWADYTIQKHLQESRVRDFEADRLDIALDGVISYVNVLLATTVENIQLENLRQTRKNLDLARVREEIGTARAAEVLRWESQLADNRKAVIEANAARNLAEIQLNRLLRRPAEESFTMEEVDLNDPGLLLDHERLLAYMDNPWEFKMLRAFMVQYGLQTTPEVRALQAAVAAQERSVSAATRSFYLPTLGLQASVTNLFVREGAGSEFDSSALPPGLEDLIRIPEDTSWDVGLRLEYALFEGGRKIARRRQTIENLTDLRLQLASVQDKVEQRIRSAFHNAGASYAGIIQARVSAKTAEQSLRLVEDSYSRGAVTILDLLDAQNVALVSAEIEAQAVFDFLIDLAEAERAVGLMVIEMSQPERDDFFDRIDNYFGTETRLRQR